MFETIRQLIEAYDPVILHRHRNPDGDALGSQIGMKHLILANFPGKTVYMVGDPAGRYAFMEDSVMDQVEDACFSGALSIILDTSGAALISDDRYRLAAATARLDHHLFIEQIAQAEVTDDSYESCCGLVTAMAVECGWEIPLSAAQALFTGLVTDSGRFRYDAVTARTFRLAAQLLKQPIDTQTMYRQLYETDLEQLKLRAAFTQKIRVTEQGVAYIYTTMDEMNALPLDSFSVSRGMVNLMSDIRGVDIWVNFTETDAGVLCELRSGTKNINPIAVKYGGGGHKKASGATVKSRKEAMAMLDDLNALAKENV